MATTSHPRKSGRAGGPRGRRLWCTECETDEHLVIESIDALRLPRTGLVDVAYSCFECDYFYTHVADVSDVAAVLNRPGRLSGVLQFGRDYLHCGAPMKTAGAEDRSIYTPASIESFGGRSLEVYLRTRVLRCDCGFQMEIPD